MPTPNSPTTRRMELVALADECRDLADSISIAITEGPVRYAHALGLIEILASTRITLAVKLKDEARNQFILAQRASLWPEESLASHN